MPGVLQKRAPFSMGGDKNRAHFSESSAETIEEKIKHILKEKDRPRMADGQSRYKIVFAPVMPPLLKSEAICGSMSMDQFMCE